MKISVLTLFPDCIKSYIDSSIIKNALKQNKIQIEIINFRDFSLDKHKKVDDYQYGGGPGMVLMLQPIVDAIKHIKTTNSYIILLSPQGDRFNQIKAKSLSKKYEHLILLCGHYEGFDERIIHYIDEIISIGDYILTGGEIPAMILIDSIVRLTDNVINKDSLLSETFNNNLLDYPVYTRPIDFDGHKVPVVLLSGNHKNIKLYKKNQQILKGKKIVLSKYKELLKKGDNNA